MMTTGKVCQTALLLIFQLFGTTLSVIFLQDICVVILPRYRREFRCNLSCSQAVHQSAQSQRISVFGQIGVHDQCCGGVVGPLMEMKCEL